MPGLTVEAEALLAEVFEATGDCRCLLSSSGHVLLANKAWIGSLDGRAAHALGLQVGELVLRVAAALREFVDGGGRRVELPPHQDFRFGRTGWWGGSLAPLHVGGDVDILLSEVEVPAPAPRDAPVEGGALQRAREVDLARRLNDIELVVSPGGQLVEANDRAVAAYGYTREELLRLRVEDLRLDFKPVASAQLAEALEVGTRFEALHRRKDGSHFPVEVSLRGFHVHGQVLLHCIVRDLSAQVEAEAALRRRERELALALSERDAVLENSPLAAARALGDRWAWGNARLGELLGWSSEALEGALVSTLFPGEAAWLDFSGRVRAELRERGTCKLEVALRHRDGHEVWCRAHGRAGRLPGEVIWFFEDITAQRASAQALVESEARLSRVLAASREGFVEWYPGRGWFERSPRVLEMVGRSAGEVPPDATAFFALLHPDDQARARDTHAFLAAGGEAATLEYRLRHVDGTWRWLEARAARRVLEGGEVVISAAITDVTARHEAEERLRTELARNEGLVAELKAALSRVKALSGLLPICMHCHKIRDDHGAWSRLEQYIVERSEASFTHSLCSDCLELHYPAR